MNVYPYDLGDQPDIRMSYEFGVHRSLYVSAPHVFVCSRASPRNGQKRESDRTS